MNNSLVPDVPHGHTIWSKVAPQSTLPKNTAETSETGRVERRDDVDGVLWQGNQERKLLNATHVLFPFSSDHDTGCYVFCGLSASDPGSCVPGI